MMNDATPLAGVCRELLHRLDVLESQPLGSWLQPRLDESTASAPRPAASAVQADRTVALPSGTTHTPPQDQGQTHGDVPTRTAKDALAAAAAAAWQIDRTLNAAAHATGQDRSATTSEPTRADRRRRPVAVLLRELRECLQRVCAHLDAIPGNSIPTVVADDLARLSGLLR